MIFFMMMVKVTLIKKCYFPDDFLVKQEKGSKFNNAETIPYASPRNDSNNEADEKKY